MTDNHRSGLPTTARDTRPLAPTDYNPANVADARHGIFGAGHDDAMPELADALNAFHRERGRAIRTHEKQLPTDGYMNPFTNVQWHKKTFRTLTATHFG